MDNLYDRINTICKNKGITIGRMCREIGISKGIFSSLKNGTTKSLSQNTLVKISNYLEVPLESLLGIKKEPVEDDKLNPELKYLIDKMQTMTDEEIKALGRIVDSVLDLRDK